MILQNASKLSPSITIIGHVSFVTESKGDPIGAYPTVMVMAKPYNLWLTENVLQVVLARWTGPAPDDAGRPRMILHDLEWGSGRARMAFQDILPAASAAGDPAVLAAIGVTTNLQRTLAILAEFLLSNDSQVGTKRKELQRDFNLSRFWCGLIDYAENAPYFPAPIREPKHASRIHPTRRDPQHLTNALWCSVGDVERACENGLMVLRDSIKRDGIVNQGDLHHFHAHAIPRRETGS